MTDITKHIITGGVACVVMMLFYHPTTNINVYPATQAPVADTSAPEAKPPEGKVEGIFTPESPTLLIEEFKESVLAVIPPAKWQGKIRVDAESRFDWKQNLLIAEGSKIFDPEGNIIGTASADGIEPLSDDASLPEGSVAKE